MTKKKLPATAQVSSPPVSECWHVLAAAENLGVARSTIVSAIAAGHIPTHPSGCGKQMVVLKDLQAYVADPPPRGGKRKPAE